MEDLEDGVADAMVHVRLLQMDRGLGEELAQGPDVGMRIRMVMRVMKSIRMSIKRRTRMRMMMTGMRMGVKVREAT